MKVFNAEVKSCGVCYCSGVNMHGEYYCKVNMEEIKDITKIHKDCLFNKPITKDVFEGFGFIFKEDNDFELYELQNEDYSCYEIMVYEDKICISEYYQKELSAKIFPREHWSCNNLFIGTINSPEELKFILTSLGVI